MSISNYILVITPQVQRLIWGWMQYVYDLFMQRLLEQNCSIDSDKKGGTNWDEP